MRTGGAWRRIASWVTSALLASTLAASTPKDPTTAAFNEKWRHYRSPNFELYSAASEAESRGLLRNLELLRAVFFDRFRLIERRRLELTVFLFDQRDHFLAYAPPGTPARSQVGAFYHALPDRAIISIGPVPVPRAPVITGPVTITTYTTPAQHLVFHEYIHHLFQATNQQPTLWFGEGVAEMLATIRVERDRLELGHANSPTLLLLQNNPLLPFEHVFGATQASPVYREHSRQGMFYAQSWALLHYLHFGESKLPREGIERFVRVMGDRRLAQTTDIPALFRECFGIDYAEMQRRLDRYIGNGKYRSRLQPLPQIPPAASYAMRPVAPEEARVRLSELALRVQRSPAGKLALLEARDAKTTDPRVHETLGTAAFIEQDISGARAHWERAIELGSANVAVIRELGLLESREWLQRFDYDFRLPAQTAARLRERLLESIAREPAQCAAYEMLAWVEAFAETPAIENVNQVQQHFRQLSEKPRTLVALAMVRIRLQKPDEARAMLEDLSKLTPDPAAQKMAGIIRARLGSASLAGDSPRPANPPLPRTINR